MKGCSSILRSSVVKNRMEQIATNFYEIDQGGSHYAS